jgi:hypothetical protein
MTVQGDVILVQAEVRATPVCSPEAIVWGLPLEFASLLVASSAVVVSLIAAGGQVWSARAARTTNLAQRGVAELNAIFELNKQYNAIVFDLKKELIDQKNNLPTNVTPQERDQAIDNIKNEFFRRYWGHQYNQFRSWVNGFIPDETYKFWLGWQRLNCPRTKFLEEVYYEDGFTRGKAIIGNLVETERFFDFMQTAFRSGIPAAINLHRPKQYQRVG